MSLTYRRSRGKACVTSMEQTMGQEKAGCEVLGESRAGCVGFVGLPRKQFGISFRGGYEAYWKILRRKQVDDLKNV